MQPTDALAYWRDVAADCTVANGNAVSGTIAIAGGSANPPVTCP